MLASKFKNSLGLKSRLMALEMASGSSRRKLIFKLGAVLSEDQAPGFYYEKSNTSGSFFAFTRAS